MNDEIKEILEALEQVACCSYHDKMCKKAIEIIKKAIEIKQKAIKIIQNDTTLNPQRQRDRLINILNGGDDE